MYGIIFVYLKNIIGIFSGIGKINWATVIISVISIVIIYCVKRFINEKFKKKLPAPIPIELIVVVVATLLASYLNFSGKFGVEIVGYIPLGYKNQIIVLYYFILIHIDLLFYNRY